MQDRPGDGASSAAGPFSAWLQVAQRAVRGEAESDVACDGCAACCESSQFVHIGPDEADTLRRIPAELLFPAPGLPRGHVLMGYDDEGRCPMLGERGCTIYQDRPRTCRSYDCRIFAAAGTVPDDQPSIAARAARWRFEHPSERDRIEHDAVRAAARFVRARPEVLGDRGSSPRGSELAVAAVEAHRAFLDGADPPTVDAVRVELSARRRRDVD